MLEIYTNDDYEVLNTLDYRTIRKKKRYSTEQLKFILPHDATESGLVAADFKGIFDGDEEVDELDDLGPDAISQKSSSSECEAPAKARKSTVSNLIRFKPRR